MSRATFIRHFQQRLSRSASDLLTDIRMTVAANALKTSDMSTGAVAELAGYRFPARVQAPNGQYARPMAQGARAVG
jgi:AraC family transcriptional regulator, activator of mtrCDE